MSNSRLEVVMSEAIYISPSTRELIRDQREASFRGYSDEQILEAVLRRGVWDNTLAEQIGNKLIDLLDLPVKENGRVDTSGGDKTPVGLAKTILRVIEETERGIS
jgi:hypothetical protein